MENIGNTDTTGETVTTSTTANTAPKTKTQRTYHIRSKSDNQADTYTVLVHKGTLFQHPSKFCEECKSVTFTVPEKGALSVIDSDGGEWIAIDDPRK